jgi:hypothetical protein
MGGDGRGRWMPRPAGIRASGLEVVGQGLVEVEFWDEVGLGGVEGGGLIDEFDRELALGRSARGRQWRGSRGEVEVEEDGGDDGRIGEHGCITVHSFPSVSWVGGCCDTRRAHQGRS